MDVEMPADAFAELYERHAFKQITGGREAGVEDRHDHYRKGVAGDWRNYFDPSLRAYFREVTGDLLDALGYAD
jgi:Sulfotransferase domain